MSNTHNYNEDETPDPSAQPSTQNSYVLTPIDDPQSNEIRNSNISRNIKIQEASSRGSTGTFGRSQLDFGKSESD